MIAGLNITYWSRLVDIILTAYFSNLTTICLLQHKDFEYQPSSNINFNVFLQINPHTLRQSFVKDIFDYSAQDQRLESVGVYYDYWIKKFVAAIQESHCEGFVAFQDDIPRFASTFRRACVYSKWRSIYNRFLFIYYSQNGEEAYFEDEFFTNFANIIIIESTSPNATLFSIKTTKFVGSLGSQPNQLIELSTFNAITQKFKNPIDLFPSNRLHDLQGREVIIGAFDYRPFMVVDFERTPNIYDVAEDNEEHWSHVDGTEVHIIYTFCEIYNCTVQVDTSEKEEWGLVFPNYTGNGLIGMILEGRTQMAMGALFYWDIVYEMMDQTAFLGRSGVTCMVPAPRRVTSWTLPILPFQFTLWLGVFACLLLEALALMVARQMETTVLDEQQPPVAGGSSWWQSTQFGYISTLKLFISQGTDYAVNSHTIRVVLFACYVIDIIVTSVYGGGLSSILTLPRLEEAADSVQRMFTHNLTWVASSIDWIVSIIPPEGEKDFNPVLRRLVENFRIKPVEESRELAKFDNLGFAVERLSFGHFGNADFITSESLNRLKLMSDDIYFVLTAAIVPRQWAHLPKYNEFCLMWHSSGLDKYWESKIAADYLNANVQNQMEASRNAHPDAGPVKLDMGNFAGIIIIWVIGIFISILGFAGELLFYWLAQRKSKNKQIVSIDDEVHYAIE